MLTPQKNNTKKTRAHFKTLCLVAQVIILMKQGAKHQAERVSDRVVSVVPMLRQRHAGGCKSPSEFFTYIYIYIYLYIYLDGCIEPGSDWLVIR